MIRALCLCAMLPLCGCAGIPVGVLYGLQAAGAAAYLAKEVIGVDIALSQDTQGKVKVIAPVVTP